MARSKERKKLMKSPKIALLKAQLRVEAKEWLVILLTIILLVMSLVIAENCKKIDDLDYLAARVNSLEMQVRWGRDNNPEKGPNYQGKGRR